MRISFQGACSKYDWSNIQIGLGAAVLLLQRQVGPVHGRGLDPGVHGVTGDPQV